MSVCELAGLAVAMSEARLQPWNWTGPGSTD